MVATGEELEGTRITCLVIFTILIFLLPIVSASLCTAFAHFKCLDRAECAIAAVEIVGVSLYFIGDNLPTVVSLNAYGGTEAVEQAKFAGKVCLGISIFFLVGFPRIMQVLGTREAVQEDNKKYFLNLILGLLALLVEFDAIFTVVIRISGEECSTGGRIADFTTLGVLLVIYAIVFSGAGIKFYKLLTDHDQELRKIGVAASFFFMCVGLVTLAFHLLGDNEQPLQCGIDCQTVGYPGNETSCETLYYGLQAGFSGCSILCALLSLGLVYCVYKSSDLPDDVVKMTARTAGTSKGIEMETNSYKTLYA